VHINSGIPNHAFYLVATRLGGFAWEKAGRIWYEAIRDPRIVPDITFVDFARITIMAATRLYGTGAESEAVQAGWEEVGIRVSRDRVSIPQWGQTAVQPGA